MLVAAGVPLSRVWVGERTLHPILSGFGYTWRPGRDVVRTGYESERTDGRERWLRSPMNHLLTNQLPELRCALWRQNEPAAFPILQELREGGATDYIAFATAFGAAHRLGPVEGVVSSWTTERANGFTDEGLGALRRVVPALALALKDGALFAIANAVMETYLGGDAGGRVLRGEIARGSVEDIDAVLWFSDLTGFTRLADTMPRDQLIPLLNDYFECLVEPVHERGGQVLKFIGDGLLATFRVDALPDACGRALDAAEDAEVRVRALNERRSAEGKPITDFRLALHRGDVLYGNVGARTRLDITVVGPAVNEVARIEAMGRSLDQRFLLSSDFAAAAGAHRDRLVSVGRYALRVVSKPQELYTLLPAGGAA